LAVIGSSRIGMWVDVKSQPEIHYEKEEEGDCT
jgi:hypothetical protein